MANDVNKMLENVDWEEVAIQVEEEEKSRMEYDYEVEMLTKDLQEMKEWLEGGDRYGNW